MTAHESVELTPAGAASLLGEELARAAAALGRGDTDGALEAYVSALGLGLQLGPVATGQALDATLHAARQLAQRQDAHGLSALGPAVVGVVGQVREARVLPDAALMEAWATVAADVGALLGQIGLALTIPPQHRAGMLDAARARAALLDDATGDRLALSAWLDELDAGTKAED